MEIIILNDTQSLFVEKRNQNNYNKAIICDYGFGNSISRSTLDLVGFEDLKAYFGANVITKTILKTSIL